ncbi:MAG: two-component system sensor histidine kinase [Acidobacteria bacterium]|nr:two-component system sensor histidine kinase [Acidobacteriota bacterium]
MRIKTLYAKLALVLLALFCVMTAAYLGLTMMTARLYMDEATQRLNRTLAANLAREKPVVRDGRLDRQMLDQVFDALMAVNPNIEIYLLDAGGCIVAFSAPPGKVKRGSVALGPIRSFLAGDRLPIRGDDPRDPARQKIFSAARLDGDHYLYVILGGEAYDSVAAQFRRSYILKLSGGVAIAAVVFALAAALLIFAAMTRRVRRLAAAMESFKRSDFSGEPRVPPYRSDRGDEIDRLTATFDEMAERIVLQVKKLTEVDLLRRELVANVSHDLRTPLASLQGYLDTLLLKDGQLAPAEQRRFLEIASKHSERLGKLVAELFELARLDSQVTPIRVEPFSMAELVQDVVQKFELRAQQGGVSLEAEVGPHLPLVSGDIALMERVLENLIENAIRFTPAGGRVRVSLVPEHGRLIVRVSDTGAGIAEASLPHIFDRFWRGDDAASRGPGPGAGLGLAIAKRILEMHGTTLNAESRVNVGTTFAFMVA